MSVSIPNAHREVIGNALDHCKSLKEVVFRGTYSQWKKNEYTRDDFDGVTVRFEVNESIKSGLLDENRDIAYEWNPETGALCFEGNGDTCFDAIGDSLFYDREMAIEILSNLKCVVVGEGFTSVSMSALYAPLFSLTLKHRGLN